MVDKANEIVEETFKPNSSFVEHMIRLMLLRGLKEDLIVDFFSDYGDVEELIEDSNLEELKNMKIMELLNLYGES